MYIGFLRIFVSSSKEENKLIVFSGKIYPVSGTVMNAHLKYSPGNVFAVTKLPGTQAGYSCLYDGADFDIRKAIELFKIRYPAIGSFLIH